MAYSQSDLDAIRAAIASGELEVSYADRKIRYRSIAELLKARADIEADLNKTAGLRRPTQTRVRVAKGI